MISTFYIRRFRMDKVQNKCVHLKLNNKNMILFYLYEKNTLKVIDLI